MLNGLSEIFNRTALKRGKKGKQMNKDFQRESVILIVDDDEQIRRLIQRALSEDSYICFQASNGEEALEALERENVDVVITDITMPKMDGIKLTERIRAQYDQDVIIMTGYTKDLTYADVISKGGIDFIQKPINIEEFLIRLKRVLRERLLRFELKEALQQQQQVMEGLILTLSSTVEVRDPYTSGHQKRVAELACTIAKHMDLSEDHINAIQMAGVIHDLGKIAIPSEILSKPGRLSEIEFSLIKTHSQVGFDILKDINFHLPIAQIIHQHHERMDGSGYPQGLKGDKILLEARIMTVADVVEAMASHRPYRPALGIDTALEEISKNKGTIYDTDAANACLKVFREKGFKFEK
jgi:putative two-component system response regulator